MRMLNVLPYLDSLKIWSLSSMKSKKFSISEKTKFLTEIIKNNRMTKVYLENMIKFHELTSVIRLFPRMKFLQIAWTNNRHALAFVRSLLIILTKKPDYKLRSLCLCMVMVDDQMVEQIQIMIDAEKLIVDYRIERRCEKIYLQWT